MAHIACWEHYSSGEKSAWKAFFGAGREQNSNDLLFSNPVGHIACNTLTVGAVTEWSICSLTDYATEHNTPPEVFSFPNKVVAYWCLNPALPRPNRRSEVYHLGGGNYSESAGIVLKI